MIRVTFDKDHIYEFVTATEFLAHYAMLNSGTLYPSMMNAEGAKNLLTLRATTEGHGYLNLSLPDDEFVSAAAKLGMFTLERFNDLEKSSGLPHDGTITIFRTT